MSMTRREALGVAAGAFLATGSEAGAAVAKRPNILFAIADDWGFNHAGAYGCDWIKTPAFDRIAKAGVLFNNTFTSNPKCSPCRATILTGRNTWQIKEAINHYSIFPRDFAVYPDVLGPRRFRINGVAA
jgi:N-sulfoglucosamine sulfohydrolase